MAITAGYVQRAPLALPPPPTPPSHSVPPHLTVTSATADDSYLRTGTRQTTAQLSTYLWNCKRMLYTQQSLTPDALSQLEVPQCVASQT